MKNTWLFAVIMALSVSAYSQDKFTPAYQTYYLYNTAEADSLNWQKQQSTSYVYDSRGNILETFVKNKVDNSSSRETYKYDSENRIIENVKESFDLATGKAQLWYKHTYVFSNNGKLLQHVLVNPAQGINRRITNTYNNNDSLILIKVEDNKHGSWQHTGGIKYAYEKLTDSSYIQTEYTWRHEVKDYEKRNRKIFYYSGSNIVTVDHYKLNFYIKDWGLYIRANYWNYKDWQFTEYEYVELAAKQKETDPEKIINGSKWLDLVYDPLEYNTPVSADIYYYDAQVNSWKPRRKMYREYLSPTEYIDWSGNYDTLGEIRYTSKVTTEVDSLNRILLHKRELFAQNAWEIYMHYTNEYIYSGGELSKILNQSYSQTEAKLVDYGLTLFGDKYIVSVEDDFKMKEKQNVYPNPANSFLTISGNNSDIRNINIFDVNGRMIKNIDLNYSTGEAAILINVSDLKQGAYLLKYKVDGITKAEKLIISR